MKYPVKQLVLGAVLDQSMTLVRDHLGLLLAIASVTVPFQAIFALLQYQYLTGNNPIGFLIWALAGLMIEVPLGVLVNAAAIHAIASAYLSRPTTFGRSFRHALRRFVPSFGVFVLYGLAIFGGTLMLIIPGILFALWFALAPQIVVLEWSPVGAAMDRSRQLMKGNLLSLLALELIWIMMFMGITASPQLIPQAHLQIIAQSFLQAFTTVLGLSVSVVFYYSCRCKAENFDLQLLADAISAADKRQSDAAALTPAE